MSWVEIRRHEGKDQWAVGISEELPEQSTEVKAEEGAVDTRVEATVSRILDGVEDPLWRLEIGKHSTRYQPELLGSAFVLADAAIAAEAKSEVRLAMQVSDAATVARIAAVELSRSGAKVRRATRRRALAWLRLLIAVPVALAIHLAIVLRYSNLTRTLPAGRRLLFAIHGERSNRTHHLLPPRFDPGRNPVFVLLGRPRASLKAVARTLDPNGKMPGMVLVRPTGLGAALSSLPCALLRLGKGLSVLRDTPVTISARDLSAMVFRLLSGACQAAWWRKTGLVPEVVAFGHTGVADTTALEEAMQAAGSRTVHCVHGLSLGWNFVSHSDVGLFVCGRDAELARKFGGYRLATSVPSPMPETSLGDERWLVMTAYSHPMNPAYANNGIAPDLAILRAVEEAARSSGQQPGNITWKPHPAISLIDSEDRAVLQAAVTDLGFKPWPEDLAYDEVARFGVVMTTPSTAAIDLLKLGRLPVIVATAPLQADTVYDSFPFVARSRRQVTEILGRLDAATEIQAQFRMAWDTIRPAGPLTVEGVLNAEEGLN